MHLISSTIKLAVDDEEYQQLKRAFVDQTPVNVLGFTAVPRDMYATIVWPRRIQVEITFQ